MSKYIKLEDAINKMDEWFCEPYTPTKLLSELPTIEVSEDCISREYLLSKAYDMDNDNLVVDLKDIENAPSVTAEKSCDTCRYRELYECSDCRFASKWERIEE